MSKADLQRGGMTVAEPAETFGRRVKKLRKDAEMTQEDLAERCGLGLTTIRDLERGLTTFPQKGTVTLLADALGLEGLARDLFVASAPKRAHAERRPPQRNVPAPDQRAGGNRPARALSLSLPPRIAMLAGGGDL